MSGELDLDRYDRVLALCQLGRVEDAEAELREILREDPDDPFAHTALSHLLLDLDRPDEALESASTAIALAPDLSFGHVASADALLALGRFDDAEVAANQALRIDPEDADPWVALSRAFLGQKRFTEAVSAADRALSLEPDSEIAGGLRAMALAMSDGGSDWQGAAEGTVAVAPDSSVAHSFSGYAHLLRGGERQASEHFREALRLDPESELAQAGLADAMKASNPFFRPFFRLFLWQERLPRGWRIALTIGPIILVKALRPVAGHHPFVWGLIGLWIMFIVLCWLSVPIANVALRFSAVGRAVLPRDEKFSSSLFLVFVGAALVALVPTFLVQGGWIGTVFALLFLAFAVGSAHDVGPRLKRIVYGVAVVAGIAAVVGGALIPVRVGGGSLGAVILIAAMITGGVLIWAVRLG